MIYFVGDLDPQITWVCEKVLRKGDIVFDIGANVGIISTITAKLVGNEGSVYAFERQPNLVDLLAKSIEINHYSQISLEAISLSNHQDQMTLNMPKILYTETIIIQRYYKYQY